MKDFNGMPVENIFSYAFLVRDEGVLSQYCGLIYASNDYEAFGKVSKMANKLNPGKQVDVKIGLALPRCLITDPTNIVIVDNEE